MAATKAKTNAPASVKEKNAQKTHIIKLPKDNKLRADCEVWINSTYYLIKRGVAVEVPDDVYEILCQQERMEKISDAYIEANENE